MRQETIMRIKGVDIEVVAAELGMEVKKHRCLCPFHDDRHPSMRFRPATNRCRCFVCDKSFGSIDLVMEYKRMGFVEACRWIADRHGIWIDEDAGRNGMGASASARTSSSTRVITATKTNNVTGTMNQKTTNNVVVPDGAPQTIASLDVTLVDQKRSMESMFCTSLVENRILTRQQMVAAAEMYRLGIAKPDGVIFWQMDCQQRLRDGKIMFYGNDCHRLHDRTPSWVSYMLGRSGMLPEGYSSVKCLFGLHLLGNRPVAVVESEKTAVICSQVFPDYTWMATGGLSSLTTQMLQPLVEWSEGVQVVIFPDTDETGTTYRMWCERAQEASMALGCRFYVSDILERHATPDQHRRKIDIADYIIESARTTGG